jgi:hypothetical protein
LCHCSLEEVVTVSTQERERNRAQLRTRKSRSLALLAEVKGRASGFTAAQQVIVRDLTGIRLVEFGPVGPIAHRQLNPSSQAWAQIQNGAAPARLVHPDLGPFLALTMQSPHAVNLSSGSAIVPQQK